MSMHWMSTVNHCNYGWLSGRTAFLPARHYTSAALCVAMCHRVVHGLDWPIGWVRLGRDFSVFGGLGCVHYSRGLLKFWKDCVNAFKARLDKIWLHQVVKFVSCIWLGRVGSIFSTCSGLGRVGSVSWWVGLDRVTQNGPVDNSDVPVSVCSVCLSVTSRNSIESVERSTWFLAWMLPSTYSTCVVRKFGCR